MFSDDIAGKTQGRIIILLNFQNNGLMGQVMRKYVLCHMRTTKVQIHPRSLISTFVVRFLASLCSCADWFESYLVENPRRHVFAWCGLKIMVIVHRRKGKTITQQPWISSRHRYRKMVNRKVQEEPQAEVAANPWHQQEEKKWYRLTCA